jgi:hypothetical protein
MIERTELKIRNELAIAPLSIRCSPKTPTWSKESRFALRWSPILPAWRTDLPVYRAKYPLQAGVFGLQVKKGSRYPLQAGVFGLQAVKGSRSPLQARLFRTADGGGNRYPLQAGVFDLQHMQAMGDGEGRGHLEKAVYCLFVRGSAVFAQLALFRYDFTSACHSNTMREYIKAISLSLLALFVISRLPTIYVCRQ